MIILMEQTLQLILREHPELAASLDGKLMPVQKDNIQYFKYIEDDT